MGDDYVNDGHWDAPGDKSSSDRLEIDPMDAEIARMVMGRTWGLSAASFVLGLFACGCDPMCAVTFLSVGSGIFAFQRMAAMAPELRSTLSQAELIGAGFVASTGVILGGIRLALVAFALLVGSM